MAIRNLEGFINHQGKIHEYNETSDPPDRFS